ncbi:MAG: sigma-54 dependent transcriptional regulator [Bacteroidota bacterium]
MREGSILIVDDNKNVLRTLDLLLQFEYKNIKTISNPNELSSLPNLKSFNVVLLDMNFSAGVYSGNEGLFWLKEIKKRAPDLPVIMLTAYGDVELAVKALKQGASDFILKPWNNERLLISIKSVDALKQSKKQIAQLKQKEKYLKQVINQDRPQIIGQSESIKSILKLTSKVAQTDVNVLVTGENGTGKELIARELHLQSKRKNEVFISVDLGAISESLFESELFGHIKGAFTDAKIDRTGKFEAANGGTLFLDEIGNLSLAMQAKLLSVIQNRVISKVGSNEVIPIDIRLICATNNNLQEMVAEGTFREDLLYRINTIQIEVPSLRNRGRDIILIAEYFLSKFANKYGKSRLILNQSAKQKLLAYHWPGNVRALKHSIERAVILSEAQMLGPDDFLLESSPQIKAANLEISIEEMEQLMIQNALKKHQGNYSAAAQQLGISRQTLYNKIKKFPTND